MEVQLLLFFVFIVTIIIIASFGFRLHSQNNRTECFFCVKWPEKNAESEREKEKWIKSSASIEFNIPIVFPVYDHPQAKENDEAIIVNSITKQIHKFCIRTHRDFSAKSLLSHSSRYYSVYVMLHQAGRKKNSQ